MGPAAFAAAPGAGEHPVVHRAADRGAVSRAVGKHFLAALLAEGIEALAAELQQFVALVIAQFVAADQGVGTVALAGDAVAGEHLAHHPLHPFGGVVDLCHVFAQDPPGHVLRWGGAAPSQQLQPLRGSLRLEHQRLWDGLMRMRLAMVLRRRL